VTGSRSSAIALTGEKQPMKKFALLGILACALASAPSFAQVVVRVAPPPVVIEHPGPPPHEGYVWTGGYHRWDGNRYVWVPGRYVVAPHPHAEWVPAHWSEHHGEWVFVEGHWR
jgi:WXXGXW repeat (2 copies)